MAILDAAGAVALGCSRRGTQVALGSIRGEGRAEMRGKGRLLIGVVFAFGGSCSHDRAGARAPGAELRALDGESQVMAQSSAGLTLVIDGDVRDDVARASGAL